MTGDYIKIEVGLGVWHDNELVETKEASKLIYCFQYDEMVDQGHALKCAVEEVRAKLKQNAGEELTPETGKA
tara:strand:+ start:3005 stop:3220 length:216 start_codon:yes stop_codon:yes gene_type:complete